MTRKELDAICRVFKKWRNCNGCDALELHEVLAIELARELNDLSGNFRRDKFYAACGVTAPGNAQQREVTHVKET